MKLTTVFVSLSLMLISLPIPCQSADLIGTWCVSMSAAYSTYPSNGYYVVPSFVEEETEIVINYQEELDYGTLFAGYVVVGENEWNGFSGVLDGDEISMTHWDSVTRGKLKEKKDSPLRITFINNAFKATDRIGKTSIGAAIKGECPEYQ